MLPLPAALAAEPVHHALLVRLDPEAHAVAVVDTLAPPPGPFAFTLHAGLAPEVRTPGWRLVRGADPAPGAVPREAWTLVPRRGAPAEVTLAYGGPLDHPPGPALEGPRGFAPSVGVVGPEGVALSGASAWVPSDGGLLTYDLAVVGLPAGWTAVSSGRRGPSAPGAAAWAMPHPTEEVQLVAGAWEERSARWERADGTGVDVRALLFSPVDEDLAKRYLDATAEDLALYEGLLERYPYPSFALVENRWETGLGMPGFTLLGSAVIRLPFLLGSSYPHELLHNWWGNGVYVGAGGNWCEGLTSYLADHLFAERRGEGADHRRALLVRFEASAGVEADFPLAGFVSRDTTAAESVGYAKGALVFHMARRRMGDAAFLAALRRFDRDHRFAPATWSDLAAAFAAERPDLGWEAWVTAWTTRPGAPRVALAGAEVLPIEGGFRLALALRQTQPADPWPLEVPVAVTLAGEPVAREVVARFEGRDATLAVDLPAAPLRLDLDPAFDVVRRLDPGEVPATLAALSGAGATWVIPATAPPGEQQAWRDLAAAVGGDSPRVVDDAGPLPAGDVWLLGAANRHAAPGAFAAATGQPAAGSTVLVARGPDGALLATVATDTPEAIPGLARKLPHYGRYSWLRFTGAEPTIADRGTLAPSGGPLSRLLVADPAPAAPLPPRAPLAP